MFAWGENEVFAKGRRVSRRATTNRRSTDRCTVTNGDRRDARGRAGRRRVRREARAPARVARTGRDATARRGPAARAPNGVLRDDGGWDPRAGPHSENTPATDDIANGRRKRAARARSIGRYTYRTGARPATPLPKKVRRAATRCGWRRGAADGVRYVLHARFGCWQARAGCDVRPWSSRKRARDARASGPRGIETHLGGGDARGDGGVDDSGHFVDGEACDGRWLGA